MVNPRSLSRRGITLTEVLVALCLLMAVLGALGRALMSGYASSATTHDQNYSQQEAQRVADKIVDSLRGACSFTSGTSGSVTALFRNGDTVRYHEAQGALLCDRTSGTSHTEEVICRDLWALNVAFYSVHANDWQVAATPAEARALRVSVTLTTNNTRATETTAVKLRNEQP